MSWRLYTHEKKNQKKNPNSMPKCTQNKTNRLPYIKHAAHIPLNRMSSYVKFYRGQRRTIFRPVSIDYLIDNATDDELERHHGYIQWIFPLKEASKSQPGAIEELLTDEAIAELLGDQELKKKIKRVTRRMLKFWGISYTRNGVEIEDINTFHEKLGCMHNHNQLRMTRMLTFMRHLGWGDVVEAIKPLLLCNTPRASAAVRYWARV